MSSKRLLRIKHVVAKSRLLRFLISGGVNTAATYGVYLAGLQAMGYRAAYTVAYVFGIVLAFAINRTFVFQTHRGWRSVIMFPFVYLAQYLFSMAVVWMWIEKLHLPKEIAPLIAIVLSIPLTFTLSRFVFGDDRRADP
ncbi:Putative flippase GtrA (transmembrane translocase of bactoprenol-linked glucose) [Dyella sp. 333MFSha]|nr:Putative flippase GtrA (transmembrane translocase of bactoprenol-linked glucose) [Dyella sp. 333MFSha]